MCLSCSRTLEENIDIAAVSYGVLFHDIGKLWCYDLDENGVWVKTPLNRTIHHISKSAMEWAKFSRQLNFSEGFVDKVSHIILSHHGSREFGSPVAPLSKEAWLVHLCDNISARMDDCDKHDILKH